MYRRRAKRLESRNNDQVDQTGIQKQNKQGEERTVPAVGERIGALYRMRATKNDKGRAGCGFRGAQNMLIELEPVAKEADLIRFAQLNITWQHIAASGT